MPKITLSTVKSFIRKNQDGLFIKNISNFDGMSDSVVQNKNSGFRPVVFVYNTTIDEYNKLNISGAWFVRNSQDYLTAYDDGEYKGIEVYNSCGSFVLAIKQ